MKKLLSRFIKNESGATAIEYGLIAGLLSVVIIGAVISVGDGLTNTFESIANALPEPLAPGEGED
jgi:pilus assembly protein Flp/PilA